LVKARTLAPFFAQSSLRSVGVERGVETLLLCQFLY
jgi:hypothetical protein